MMYNQTAAKESVDIIENIFFFNVHVSSLRH